MYSFGPAADGLRMELAKRGIMFLDRREYGKINYYPADGYLGQYIYINFDKQLVGVRMIEGTDNYNPTTDGFEDFGDMMDSLVNYSNV